MDRDRQWCFGSGRLKMPFAALHRIDRPGWWNMPKFVFPFAMLTAFAIPAYAGVSDGGFERPLVGHAAHRCGSTLCAGYPSGSRIGGWKVNGDPSVPYPVEVTNTAYIAAGIQYNAADGQQSAFIAAAQAGGVASCLIHTLSAANMPGSYILTFSLGHVAGQPSATLHLIIEGRDVGIFTNDSETAGKVNWKQVHDSFGFTSGTPTIEFCNETPASGLVGLDGVRLTKGGD
jgi:hypothetical protein